jgi:hypothetical protein
MHFLIGIGKRPLCIIHRNRWHITWGTQPKRSVLCLESGCYDKSHPGPKLTASLRLMIKRLSSFVSNSCLTFLNSICLSFTPNKVYPLVSINHRAISWWFHKHLPFVLLELMYCWFWASTLHGVGPLSSLVVMISPMPLCIHPVRLSKRMSSPIAPRINSVWKFTPMGDVVLDVGIWGSSFPFRESDWVDGPRRSSNGAQHKESHEAPSDSTRCYGTHARKKKLHGKPRSFPPFNSSGILLSPRSMCHSLILVLPTSLHKSRDEISLREESFNTSCCSYPNYCH